MQPSISESPAGRARGDRRASALSVAAVLLWAAWPATAGAASFSVDPTLVRLSARAPSALVLVRNDSDGVVRLQISAFAWAQGRDGQMQLQPTEDLIFFPALLTLEPGQERRVRVGSATGYGVIEKSYRLFLEELPPASQASANGSSVHVLTRMGIPIFLVPATARTQAGLANVAVSAEGLAFDLENKGTAHFVPDLVRVTGQGEAGEPVIDRQLQGWYVLAGGARRFVVPLPVPDCSRIRALTMEVRANGSLLKERLETPSGACGP